jgi:hypothetical protein
MGVLTDFFVASEDELKSAFRGWAKPLPLLDDFIVKQGLNPFTGKMFVFRTRIPHGSLEASPDAIAHAKFHHLPWIDQKGLSSMDVVLLTEVVMDWDHDNAKSEIHGRIYAGPEGTEQLLFELPPPFVARLAATTAESYATLTSRWASKIRADAATIPNPRRKEMELGRPDSEWVTRLSEIARLAKVATESHRAMFMWICP